MSISSRKRFVTVTFTVAAVAVSYLSGRTPMARAAQEQRAAPPVAPVPLAQQPGNIQNNPACSPNPIPVGPSANNRPHVYRGPYKVSPPTRIGYVRPEYPQIARAAKVQGVVVLEGQIERDGHVCSARVLRSIPLLDQSAIDGATVAVQRSRRSGDHDDDGQPRRSNPAGHSRRRSSR